MKKKKRIMIGSHEHKQLMLGILRHIDKACRDNGIKYSLIGGSLIGAVRHGGFIPWDDDLDIILDYVNYHKLIKILVDYGDNRYKVLIPGETERYPLQFAKVIDTNTCIDEYSSNSFGCEYGVFVDVFCYNNMPENLDEGRKYYKKYLFLMKCLNRTRINGADSLHKQIVRFFKNAYLSVFGYKKSLKRILNLFETNTNLSSRYVMSNAPGYGFEEELQLKKDIKDYIDIMFDGTKTMIFKNYDAILTKTYGDYMSLPPESSRISKHDLKIWWKEGKEPDLTIRRTKHLESAKNKYSNKRAT